MTAEVIIVRENSSGCLGNVWIKSDFYALLLGDVHGEYHSQEYETCLFLTMCCQLFLWSNLEIENHMDIQVFIKMIPHKHRNWKSPQNIC